MKAIVVAAQGFVFLGEMVRLASGNILLTEASTIRRWGTTKGLGEIALGGPTKSTVLDPCGTVEIESHAVVHVITCTYA